MPIVIGKYINILANAYFIGQNILALTQLISHQ